MVVEVVDVEAMAVEVMVVVAAAEATAMVEALVVVDMEVAGEEEVAVAAEVSYPRYNQVSCLACFNGYDDSIKARVLKTML